MAQDASVDLLAAAADCAVDSVLVYAGGAPAVRIAPSLHPDVVLAFPDVSPRNQDQRRKDDETDARLGLRTVNEIRRARGLDPYPDARFDKPFAGEATPPTPPRASALG